MKKKILILMMVLATTITTLLMLPSKSASALEDNSDNITYELETYSVDHAISFPKRMDRMKNPETSGQYYYDGGSYSEIQNSFFCDGLLSSFTIFNLSTATTQNNFYFSYDLNNGESESVNTFVVVFSDINDDYLMGFKLVVDDVEILTISNEDLILYSKSLCIKLNQTIEATNIKLVGISDSSNWVQLHEFNATYYEYEETDENKNSHVISFKTNGGSLIGTIICNYGDNLYGVFQTVDYSRPTKSGYEFAGWYLDETLSIEVNIYSYTVTSNITLFAKWNPINYSVIFNSNGGLGVMESQNFQYGQEQPLYSNQFSKTGYKFVGWATSLDGEVVLSDKEVVTTALTTTEGDIINLYAVWELDDVINGDNNNNDNIFGDLEEQVEEEPSFFEELFTKDNLICIICLVAICSFVASLFGRRR